MRDRVRHSADTQPFLDRQEKQIKYDHVLVAFILYFLNDSLWAAIVYEVIPKSRVTVLINAFLIYVFMTAIIYCWLQFVMAYDELYRAGAQNTFLSDSVEGMITSFAIPPWNIFCSLFFNDVSHIEAKDDNGKQIKKNITPQTIYAGA